MKARFKLIGLIFCLVLFLVPTFHFQAIPAEGDKVADAKEKLEFNKKYPDGTKRKVLDISILKKLKWKSKISSIFWFWH